MQPFIVVAAITLALDLLVSAFIPAATFDTWVMGAPVEPPAFHLTPTLHHDLNPGLDREARWGPLRYRLKTDELGLRTGTCDGAASDTAPAVFLIGDSFIEGIGLDFEKTLAGLIACEVRRQGKVAYNLGVRSYSPIIYWRKVMEVAERLKRAPAEIIVFLDISDIQDEAEIYEETASGIVMRPDRPPMQLRYDIRDRKDWPDLPLGLTDVTPPPATGSGLGVAIRRNSMIGALLLRLYGAVRQGAPPTVAIIPPTGLRRSMWTVDDHLMKSFGERGLASAAANLGKLVGLCREWKCALTLAVYPWPDQVANNDRDSIQVRYWRNWSAAHGVRFVDAFEPFFARPAADVLRDFYIPHDVHFTERGNRAVFEAWRDHSGP